MGYTHYWTQNRSFTAKQWRTICSHIRTILVYATTQHCISLANGLGEPGTSPQIDSESILFNGLGKNAHETFHVERKCEAAGADREFFCKTEGKPYDVVVTACLSYLSTATRREDSKNGNPILGTEALTVSSDGKGKDFLLGLDLARQAIPHLASILDIPEGVMRSDRWCAPWVDLETEAYRVHFCVDGKGYVIKVPTGESYCFESHLALARYLDREKVANFRKGEKGIRGSYSNKEDDIWNPSGDLDAKRINRLAKAQAVRLSKLFPVDALHAMQPPAFVRPNELATEPSRPVYDTIDDLLKSA